MPSQEVQRVIRIFMELVRRAQAGEEVEAGWYRGSATDPYADDPATLVQTLVRHRIRLDIPNPRLKPDVEVFHQKGERRGERKDPRKPQGTSSTFLTPEITYMMFDTPLARVYEDINGWQVDLQLGGGWRYITDERHRSYGTWILRPTTITALQEILDALMGDDSYQIWADRKQKTTYVYLKYGDNFIEWPDEGRGVVTLRWRGSQSPHIG